MRSTERSAPLQQVLATSQGRIHVGLAKCFRGGMEPWVDMCYHLGFLGPITGWWLGHPSEKYEFVNWDDDYSQYFWENKIDVPNHQPAEYMARFFNHWESLRICCTSWAYSSLGQPSSNGLSSLHLNSWRWRIFRRQSGQEAKMMKELYDPSPRVT